MTRRRLALATLVPTAALLSAGCEMSLAPSDDPGSSILPEDQNELARRIAMNITQVASILFPHLADLYEHHNPLSRS